MKPSLVALHGFLGGPSDWAFLAEKWQLIAPDLVQEPIAASMNDWAKGFCQQIVSTKNILVGYSMGGRLALHALKNEPKLWSAAIFVSTHPGLKSDKERQERFKSDLAWAGRFIHEPWDPLMKSWNEQTVFQGSAPIMRKEGARELLSNMLINWSLSKQDSFYETIKESNIPILWVVGEQDQKYVQLANELSFKHPLSQKVFIEGAAHRILREAEQDFMKRLTEFITKIA